VETTLYRAIFTDEVQVSFSVFREKKSVDFMKRNRSLLVQPLTQHPTVMTAVTTRIKYKQKEKGFEHNTEH